MVSVGVPPVVVASLMRSSARFGNADADTQPYHATINRSTKQAQVRLPIDMYTG
jgi:hypothetical protein